MEDENTPKKSNKLVISVVGILIVLGVLIFVGNKLLKAPDGDDLASEMQERLETEGQASTSPLSDQNSTANPTEQASSSAMQTGNVKEFTVTGSNFKFDLSEIKVNKGDTVKVTFKNSGGTHDWVVDEFSAQTKKISAGQQDTVTFVADKTGTFEYYCSVGSHRQMGMKGNLIVE